MNKQSLCNAFFHDLRITEVPAGLAVGTDFTYRDGDPVGFYITPHPTDAETYRLEDSGLVVPFLVASGIDLDRGNRAYNFHRLLQEYAVSYDALTMELHSRYVAETELPAEAVRFVALLLRLQDLEWLVPNATANAFRREKAAA